MAVIVRARNNDSSDNVIKKFKKLSMIENIVAIVRDREFYKKPALLKKEHNKEIARMKHREKRMAKRDSR